MMGSTRCGTVLAMPAWSLLSDGGTSCDALPVLRVVWGARYNRYSRVRATTPPAALCLCIEAGTFRT